MKMGDLVRRRITHYAQGAATSRIGIVIKFTGDYHDCGGNIVSRGTTPIIYWDEVLHSEVERREQLEVISHEL